MTRELLETIRFQKSMRDSQFPNCPYLFFNEKGDLISRFNWPWESACNKSKPPYSMISEEPAFETWLEQERRVGCYDDSWS